jgi:hypothetical protein
MSGLEKRYIYDPRINTHEILSEWVSFIGPTGSTYERISANGGKSDTSTEYKIDTLSNSTTFLDRNSLIQEVPVTITLTGNGLKDPTKNIYNPRYEGFRCRPLDKCNDTLTIAAAGGATVTTQPKLYDTIQEKFIINEDNRYLIPAMFDRTQTYAGSDATNLSPFAKRMDNLEVSRSCYPITVVSNTPTQAVLTSTIYRKLGDYAPLTMMDDVIGMASNPISIRSIWTHLERMWSRDLVNHPQNITDIVIHLDQTYLQYKILNLPYDLKYEIPMTIPPVQYLPYNEVYYTSAQYGPIASGATFTINIPNTKIEKIPHKIYLAVKPSDAYLESTHLNAIGTTDTFAKFIGPLNMKLGQENTLFTDYTPEGMFEITKRNGLHPSIGYVDWIGLQAGGNINDVDDPPLMGSVLCIDPVRDIGSGKEIFTTGLTGDYNIAIQSCPFQNISPNPMTFDAALVIVYDGITELYGRTGGSATNVAIQSISELRQVEGTYQQYKALMGGSRVGDFFKKVWGKIKEVAPKVNDFLKKTHLISNIVSKIPYVQDVAPFIRTFGYGGDGGDGGDSDDGGMLAYGEGEGGAVLDRGRLNKNMKKHRPVLLR